MNEKVQLFADYWMKLYSNCCLQRDYAVEFLDDKKPDEAKGALQDWPDTYGSPRVPQLLFEEPPEPNRKKRSAVELECDGAELIYQMKENYFRGERVHFDVPRVLPEREVSLAVYGNYIKHCDDCFKVVENYVVQYAFAYVAWLSKAFHKFKEEKRMRWVFGSFDDWVNSRCKVKQTRARQLTRRYWGVSCHFHGL